MEITRSPAQPTPRHTPLDPDEKVRAEATFAQLAAEMLIERGRFRVTADTPDMVELFQKVARRAGEMLRRPVVSYADGRDILITFAEGTPGLPR